MTRVIAGRLRGRRLKTPPPRDRRTRPTSDRTKTVLFDLLGPIDHLESALDLFAGTGALGIEAFSRGVERVTFVDQAGAAVRLVRENLDRVGVESGARVVQRDVHRFVGDQVDRWGLVLADPPYGDGHAERLLATVGAENIVLADGIFALEHEPGLALAEESGTLVRIKHRRAGSTEISLYRSRAEE